MERIVPDLDRLAANGDGDLAHRPGTLSGLRQNGRQGDFRCLL
jgi:predicted ester cyclase